MKSKFTVTGMHCASCQAAVERCVRKLSGVRSAEVNLINGVMTVDFDEKTITAGDICSAVKDAGFGAESDEKPRQRSGEPDSVGIRFLLSLIFLLPLLCITSLHMLGMPLPAFLDGSNNGYIQLALTIPVLLINCGFFIGGVKALLRGAPNMDTLIASGAAASFLFSVYVLISGGPHLYFESAAMILTLITLGKYLEARSKRRTGDALAALEDMSPKTAIVLKDGVESEIPASELAVGDIVILKPGMSAPVDGTVTEGSSYLDQSAVTGESEYVYKQQGDPVISASVNHGGYLRFEATAVGDDTSFSRIVRLVSEASASKAPIQRLADKVAGIFVPAVLAVSLITLAVWLIAGGTIEQAVIHAVSVLVISCPCALGLAAPVAVMTGTGRGAQLSILFGSAEILERTCGIDTVALDKTGTITEGRPRVTDMICFGNNDPLAPAAALERHSEHPIAAAICEYASGIALPSVGDFKSIPGKGVSGIINGVRCLAGNPSLMESEGVSVSESADSATSLKSEGKTVIYIAADGKLIGIIAVADPIRATSRAAVEELKSMDISVLMLTGDNARTAEVIAKSAGIEDVHADLLPENKAAELSLLRDFGTCVAMVGDGINDAPALTGADIGISLGAGTDIALRSSDIILLRDDLADVPTAIRLSRAVVRNIKQNFFWAFFYNMLGIPLAAGVFTSWLGWQLSPAFAAAAMSVSSLFVVGNSLRLRFFRPKKH